MQTRDVAAGWLRELAIKSGSAPFELDENGACLFEFAGRLQIGVQVGQTAAVVHLYAVVAQPPDQAREQFFQRLLRLNAFGVETGGAAFALHEQTGSVILWYNVAVAGCDPLGFENAFGCFLEVAQRWQDELGRVGDPAPASPNPEPTNALLRV